MNILLHIQPPGLKARAWHGTPGERRNQENMERKNAGISIRNLEQKAVMTRGGGSERLYCA